VPLEQTLLRQVWPAAQTVPQAPQLLALVEVFTQAPLHSVGAAVGHVQALF
jgi:hypothetical protein